MVWRPPDAWRCRGFGLASAAFSRPWIDGGLSCFVVVLCLFHQQDKDLTANMSIYLLGIKHGTIIEEMLHLLLLSRAWLVQVYLNNRHVCHDQGVSSPFIAYGERHPIRMNGVSYTAYIETRWGDDHPLLWQAMTMAGLLLLNQLQRVMSPYGEIHSQTDFLLCIRIHAIYPNILYILHKIRFKYS